MVIFLGTECFAQHSIKASAALSVSEKTLSFSQKIQYKNTSENSLQEIYLNDWANSFSSKTTPLAERFAEDYYRKYHYAKDHERGYTIIENIQDSLQQKMRWVRPENMPDVIRVELTKPLLPNETTEIQLNYVIKIPDDKFTGFGYGKGTFKLKYWMILPAVYNGDWNVYSHKNLHDLFIPKLDFSIDLRVPLAYNVISNLDVSEPTLIDSETKKVSLTGKDRIDLSLYVLENDFFETYKIDDLEVVSNIQDNDIKTELKELTLDRAVDFLEEKLGKYPYDKIVVSEEDYDQSPVYGFNQLPRFIRPFPDGFQYDIKLLKTITKKYLNTTLLLNPREEKWLVDAIHIYLMMEYVKTYYDDVKLIGSFSEIIGLRWFHLADLEFNDRYHYLFMNMARLNLDQALTTPQDSLVKFNKNIANPYKAGLGFNYIDNFLADSTLQKSIKEFYVDYTLKPVHPEDFERILKKNTSKNIDWFFTDFVPSNNFIDFKISEVKKTEDSLSVVIINKYPNKLPVSLFGLKNDSIVAKYWIEDVNGIKKVTIPRDEIDRLALNHDGVIPEINRRNNYHRVTTLLHKPIQFRLLDDVEDPAYQQFFIIPEFDYNLYDGLTIGPKLYNKSILRRNFNYKIAPKYGFTSGALVGSASISNVHQYKNQKMNAVQYGFSGTRYSYAQDLYYHKVTPFFNIYFRNPYLRDNEKQAIGIRSVNVFRDRAATNPVDEPDYSVFNLQYNYSNQNFADYFTASFDYQIAKKFSKLSFESKWRKLFLNNRQLEFRFFAGAFLFNDSKNSDYFSFALDRPTDYLFDYNYYGRSESEGLFSQQYIEAEGGFKSQLQPEFANQWITSLNSSFTMWNWIHAYGDVGLVKNSGNKAKFLYDSGVRVSLVQDYFELFFPVYSNLGWEIDQPNYDQKIRFIVSLDINTLLKLFTRRWY